MTTASPSLFFRPVTRTVGALLLCATSAVAQICPEEPLVQHWTGSGGTVSAGFVAGEEWGSVFDTEIPASHYPIEIMRIGYGWGSLLGGAPPTLGDSIRIYPGGLPNPGTAQFVLGGPQLIDGVINEFDLDAIPNSPGLNRVIQQGPFSVSLKLLTDTPPLFGPAPSHDGPGSNCQPGKNLIFCIGPGLCNGWVDACSVGSSGDWQIHVVYRRLDCNSSGPGISFCVGTGPDINGCTPCPCGNNAFPGSEGGCLNSNFRSCQLTSSGDPSLAMDTLRFEATGATSNTFGILVSGNNQLPNMGMCPPGSGISNSQLDGLRCVGGGAIRHGTRPSDANGDIGLTTNGWGPPNGPPGGLIAAAGFASGQIRHFQVFYRESNTAGCMSGQNTSNALTVTFTP